MRIRIKKLHPSAVLPSYAYPGDAGMDFFALENTKLVPDEIKAVKTGISMEIPEDYVGLIWDKGGIGGKEGIKVLGGVFDSGYRGEILISMINLSKKDYVFEAGHKVAQMLVQKIETAVLEVAEELSDTKRGTGRFGSTGK